MALVVRLSRRPHAQRVAPRAPATQVEEVNDTNVRCRRICEDLARVRQHVRRKPSPQQVLAHAAAKPRVALLDRRLNPAKLRAESVGDLEHLEGATVVGAYAEVGLRHQHRVQELVADPLRVTAFQDWRVVPQGIGRGILFERLYLCSGSVCHRLQCSHRNLGLPVLLRGGQPERSASSEAIPFRTSASPQPRTRRTSEGCLRAALCTLATRAGWPLLGEPRGPSLRVELHPCPLPA